MPLRPLPPSSLHREEKARCLEPKYCNRRIRNVPSRRSTMHPVRPGGTRTTDSSSPMAQLLASLVRTAPGDVCPRSLRMNEHSTNGSSSAARRPPLHRRAILSADDPFDRRRALHTFHEIRLATQASGAPSTPYFLLWTERVLRGAFVMYSPTLLLECISAGALTRRCLFRFCHRHYMRATKPMLIVLARPGTTPGWDQTESTPLQMLRAALGAPVRMRPSPT